MRQRASQAFLLAQRKPCLKLFDVEQSSDNDAGASPLRLFFGWIFGFQGSGFWSLLQTSIPTGSQPLAGGLSAANTTGTMDATSTHPEGMPATSNLKGKTIGSTYVSLHYHIVFSTKHRHPMIPAKWREQLHDYLGGTANGLGGFSQGVGGPT